MESPVPNNDSLYRRVLGKAFDSLPPVMKRFHDHPHGATASGSFRITRGQGGVRQALATLMRLPRPGEQVPVLLQVQVHAQTECWTRDFGSLRLLTRQWLHNGLLMETAGPLRFGFHLSADAQEMRFVFARCWFLCVPLPAVLAPRVNAWACEYQEGWWIKVCVEVPLLGMLTEYEGKVTPQ